MGGKLIWNLIYGEKSRWKEILWKRVFLRASLRCINDCNWEGDGSKIWTLCKLAIKIIQGLYWIIDNGEKINLWKYSIMGEAPLNHNEQLKNIKE